MQRRSQLDQSTATRARKLGELGEELAANLLIANGFEKVRNLNREAMNYPYADFYAERAHGRYAISVKIRNRYEAGTGRLNSRYKLGAKCYELAVIAERTLSASAAWLAVALEAQVFSAYFGLLAELGGSCSSVSQIPPLSREAVALSC